MIPANPYWEALWPESIDSETGEDASPEEAAEDDYSEDSFP